MSTKQLRCGAFAANEKEIKMPPELSGEIKRINRDALKKLIKDEKTKTVIVQVEPGTKTIEAQENGPEIGE